MPFSHQSALTRRNLLIHNNFDLNYNISSDFNFFFTQYVRKKKFKKIDLFISIIKSGGLSDKKRITVFKENYKILKKNNLFYKNSVNFLITFLFLIIKKIFKTILPNYIEEMILKIKYKDRIYKK